MLSLSHLLLLHLHLLNKLLELRVCLQIVFSESPRNLFFGHAMFKPELIKAPDFFGLHNDLGIILTHRHSPCHSLKLHETLHFFLLHDLDILQSIFFAQNRLASVDSDLRLETFKHLLHRNINLLFRLRILTVMHRASLPNIWLDTKRFKHVQCDTCSSGSYGVLPFDDGFVVLLFFTFFE